MRGAVQAEVDELPCAACRVTAGRARPVEHPVHQGERRFLRIVGQADNAVPAGTPGVALADSRSHLKVPISKLVEHGVIPGDLDVDTRVDTGNGSPISSP